MDFVIYKSSVKMSLLNGRNKFSSFSLRLDHLLMRLSHNEDANPTVSNIIQLLSELKMIPEL